MRLINITQIVLVSLITFMSCEKEPLFDEKLGYFKGTVGGVIFESGISDTKYISNTQFTRYTTGDVKSYLDFILL